MPKIYYLKLLIFLYYSSWRIPPTNSCLQPPPVPLNSRLVNGHVVCDPGYELVGDKLANCRKDGEWDGVGRCLKPTTYPTTSLTPSTLNKSTTTSPSCLTTLPEPSPFIRLNLHTHLPIYSIELNTTQPTNDIELRVGNQTIPGRNLLCSYKISNVNTTEFICNRVITGEFVFIQMIGDGVLGICGIRIKSEKDPNRCLTSGSDPTLTHNNTCYTIHTSPLTQKQSQLQCTKQNSTLLNQYWPIQHLNNLLNSVKDSLRKQLLWIGVERDSSFTSRTWRWIGSNLIVKKPMWGRDQPNNYNGEQNCIVLDGGREWLWNDVGCELEFSFICLRTPQTCPSPDVNAGLVILNNKTYYNVNDVIEYKCSTVGYYMEGSEKRVCDKSGEWLGSSPLCKFASCPPLNDTLTNGSILKSNHTSYGSIYKYSCKDNYTLIGTSERFCDKDGSWSGSDDTQCLFSICPQLTPPTNGTIIINSYTPSSTARYKCNPGSTLIGSQTRECQLGGQWSNTEPTCKFIQCSNVINIANGFINQSTGLLNDVKKPVCNQGYKLIGGGYVCDEFGNWDGNGYCDVVNCGEPEVPTGSIVTGYEFVYDSVINYSCEDGHLLIGNEVRRCGVDGVWSGVVPECRYIDCGPAPLTPSIQLKYLNQSTHLNSYIKYTCPSNYNLIGPNIIICTKQAQWSKPIPKCEEIRCKYIQPDKKLHITTIKNDNKQNYKLGSIIKLHCERGYKLIGNLADSYTCINGTWSPSISQDLYCKFINCTTIPNLANGYFKLSTSNLTTYGSSLIYNCNPGYKLVGRERHICSEGGEWLPGLDGSYCNEIRCKSVEWIKADGVSVGSVGYVRCGDGWNVIGGDERRVCQEDGEWSGSQIGCEATTCPHPPPTIQNSRTFQLNQTIKHNTIIEIHCKPGYTGGPYIIKCLNQKWSSTTSLTDCLISTNDSNLLITIVVSLILVALVICVVIFMVVRRKKKVPKTVQSRQGEPVVVYQTTAAAAGGQVHYYDNPTIEHLYEDLGSSIRGQVSGVTINGVAV